MDKIEKTEAQWQAELDPESYHVCRKKGTEAPFSGKFNDHYESGTYQCKCCGLDLFESGSKFDSGCGWPSFDQPINEEHIATAPDFSHGRSRTEVLCPRCDAHLGHVFPDGPTDTGLRYCINSVSIDFDHK